MPITLQRPPGSRRAKAVSKLRTGFAQKRYVVLRSFLPEAAWQELGMHALAAAASGTLRPGDDQVAGCPCAYGDARMEAELVRLVPEIEAIAGEEVFPTYSYFRVYLQGASLKRHRDREACELSVTICLGGDPWAVWIEGPQGRSRIVLKPGDAVLYRGMECPHWRNPFRGRTAIQLFLHYVAQSGPCASWKFDKRPGPGAPSAGSTE